MGKPKTASMKIHWWEDAYGRHTCHKNDAGLSFKESILGELQLRSDGYYYLLINNWTTDDQFKDRAVGPYKHVMTARRALEAAVGGEPITTWD